MTSKSLGVCLPLLILALAATPACKGRRVRSRATQEGAPGMASVLNMNEPGVEPQLVSGFYGLESGAWRWTAKQFSVSLHPPFGAAQKGGKLSVKLTIPGVVIDQNKTVTLSGTAGNAPLAPETYTTPGDYFYVRDVPAGALSGEAVRFDFWLDKAMKPGGGDIRELGIIVSSIGLEAK